MIKDVSPNIGKYHRLLELGQGGMATAWLTVLTGPDGFRKLQVIKQPLAKLNNDPTYKTRFLSEARLAAKLHHPNIVQTIEVTQEANTYYIVMEYVEGQNLRTICAKRKLPVQIHLQVICDLLSGLHHLHEFKDFDGTAISAVHRDVNPSNVMISYDGQVKLMDFGIAKAQAAEDLEPAEFKGKLRYAAPEQVLGQDMDNRTDLFAVGVMLWEAIAGKNLWSGISEQKIMANLKESKIPNIIDAHPLASPALVKICNRALQPNPNARFQTAYEMKKQIEKTLTSIKTESRHDRLARFMKFNFGQERDQQRSEIKNGIDELAASFSRETSYPVAPSQLDESAALPKPPLPPIPSLEKEKINWKSLIETSKFSDIIEKKLFCEIENTIKTGPTSVVLEACHLNTKRKYLLKTFVIKPQVQNVELTLTSQAAINHPCTSRLLDVCSIRANKTLFCMCLREYIEGQLLDELIRKKQMLSPTRAANLSTQLLISICDAHAAGIIHGRIDPGHAIISKDIVGGEHLKVIDFEGFLQNQSTVSDYYLELPDYSALAQKKHDLVSAALVILQMLAGILPAQVRSNPKITSQALNKRLPQNKQIQDFFEKALHANPKFRHRTAQDMLTDFSKIDFFEEDDSSVSKLLPVDSFNFEKDMTNYTNAGGFGSFFSNKCRTVQTDVTPSIWVLMADPAVTKPEMTAALVQLKKQFSVVMLDDEQKKHIEKEVISGNRSTPWLIILGDLDILLEDSFLKKLTHCTEMSKVLVSTHPNVDLLSNSINAWGLDQFICLPEKPETIVESIKKMLNRTKQMLVHQEKIKKTLQQARENVSQMNRTFAATGRESVF